MKNYFVCKACGFIAMDNEVKDFCPACGVPAKLFEPYESRLSEKRDKLLSKHLHPIILHLPMSFVIMALVFDISSLIFNGQFNNILQMGAEINTVLLPFGVIVAALFGMLDGKTRFKRLTTKHLQLKMILAAVLFLISCVAALIIIKLEMTTPIMLLLIFLDLAALATAGILGKTGSKLMNAALPG